MNSPTSGIHWEAALLSLAALWLIPQTAAMPAGFRKWCLVAGVLLGASFVLPAGSMAAVLTVPWLAVTVALAAAIRKPQGGIPSWTAAAGLVYAIVGAVWTFAARLGLRPLDFDEEIVLLTAVHFHYAGAMLALLTARAARELPGFLSWIPCVGVVISVPLTASGITATKLNQGAGLEIAASVLMAASGAGAAGL